MPIKRENAAKYPGGSIRSPEWLAIREAIRERAGDRCEECGVKNGAVGIRLPSGEFLELGPLWRPGEVAAIEFSLLPLSTDMAQLAMKGAAMYSTKVVRIVCTTAHFDNDLVDHSLGNLRFWCQRCHLGHDQAMRRAGD